MDIRTIAINSPMGQESQTDFRGTNVPSSILIALADGRIITVGPVDGYGDRIVVHGPDMETLMDVALPNEATAGALSTAGFADAIAAFGAAVRGEDSPAGAGEEVQATRG